jgi:tripartite-type tricarboxylate transporter receptor subunit TctC
MKKRQLLQFTAACAAAALLPAAHAQTSAEPLRIIVPYSAGGPLDTAARVLADKVRAKLGGNVVVENKPGAGGNVGAAMVAKAAPDGRTLVMGAVATHAINPWLVANMPYDALKDFTPITLVARVPNVLVMNAATAAKLKVKTTKELLAYARKNPGKLSYASGGNGSAGHLAGELFKDLGKVSMLHIPYNGAAAAQADLLNGTVDVMFDNLASASANIKAGKLLPLGMTTINRSPLFPEVPSVNDAVVGFQISTWFGIFGPAKLPPAVVTQLNEAFTAALKDPETVAKFAQMSATPSPMSAAEFSSLVAKEHAAYGRLIKMAKIKVE